jgi:hypothetical protein
MDLQHVWARDGVLATMTEHTAQPHPVAIGSPCGGRPRWGMAQRRRPNRSATTGRLGGG